MPQTWFTSDTHFGHGNIIKYCNRPFLAPPDKKALEENGGKWHDGSWKGEFASDHRMSQTAIYMMNDELIENINDYVKPEDTLWHLGDVLFAQKHEYVEKAYGCMSRINCKNVHLIWGNHDHRGAKDRKGRSLATYFKSVQDMAEIHVNKQRIVLCHYAMAVWNKSHRGAWHLYGHSHAGAEDWLAKAMGSGRRSMDVGVDNINKLLGKYRPISFDEVKRIMDKKDGHSIDHHIDPNAPTEESLVNSH